MRRMGGPLPGSLRRQMEGFFGVDFSTVRVHVGPEPERVGALALTAGEDITFAPGAYQPSTRFGRELLGHELTHVLQQREAAPTRRSGRALVVDPALEAEADRLGRAAAAWRPGQPRDTRVVRAGCEHARGGVATMVQPWIKMAKGTGDDPFRYGQSAYVPPLQFSGYFLSESQRGRPVEEKFELLTDYQQTRGKAEAAMKFLYGAGLAPLHEQILHRWMGVVDKERKDVKIIGDVLAPLENSRDEQFANRARAQVQAELKYFFVYGELAWALMQEAALEQEKGEDSLAQERAVAELILTNPAVANQLSLLTAKAAQVVMQSEQFPGFTNAMTKPTVYGPLHGQLTYGDLVTSLTVHKPNEDVATLVARLHDVKDLFLELKLIAGIEPPFDLKLSGKTIKITKMGMRYNLGTPDEADDWVLFMRDHHRAVWAGPSYTMVHMWTMAQRAGARPLEQLALAYAIFAYWCLKYPHTATPVHRFHETMAAAHHFGLPYEPEASVQKNYELFLVKVSSKL